MPTQQASPAAMPGAPAQVRALARFLTRPMSSRRLYQRGGHGEPREAVLQNDASDTQSHRVPSRTRTCFPWDFNSWPCISSLLPPLAVHHDAARRCSSPGLGRGIPPNAVLPSRCLSCSFCSCVFGDIMVVPLVDGHPGLGLKVLQFRGCGRGLTAQICAHRGLSSILVGWWSRPWQSIGNHCRLAGFLHCR